MTEGSEIHPAPTEFSEAQLAADPILQFFHYAHLPPGLQATSRQFCMLAGFIAVAIPRNAERTVALRKLLEAKDAAVRANLPAPQFGQDIIPGKNEPYVASDNFSDAFNKDLKDQRTAAFDEDISALQKYYADHALKEERQRRNEIYQQSIQTEEALDEPKEIGGHDEDRDGPIKFED